MTGFDAALTRWPATTERFLMPASLVGLGLVMGLVGPFGSYLGMSLPVRLVHFVSNVVLIGGMCWLASILVKRLIGAPVLPLWAAVAIAVVMAPPGALIVQAGLGFWAPRILHSLTLAELVQQTLLVNLLFGTSAWALERRRQLSRDQEGRSLEGRSQESRTAFEAAPGAVAAAPRAEEPVGRDRSGVVELLSRLPSALRQGRLIALSAEDHYLKVHTDRGAGLILMSLSQAAELLGPDEGLRIHRSHWVSRTAILRRSRAAGRDQVVLEGGLELPVSRTGRRLLAALD
jgi:LytTr DNA-binding domain